MLVALGIVLWTFAPYHPPFSATHGHTMNMITAPLPWERGLRRSQSIGEIQPCSYKLLGWQEETLYYEATCGTKITTWQFTAGLAKSAVKISVVPFPFSDETIPQSSLSKYTDAPSRQPGFVSPSGKWIAIVGYQIYGPEDVLVINN